jgi:diguanylate cyclase (GGDEF)-like protein/PAS domain S-box-containing protein
MGRTSMASTPTGLAEHTSVLHTLVSSSPDHFYLYDRSGRHVYASPAAALALGIVQEDFIGKTWQELGFSPDSTERFDVERKAVFDTGRHWRGELTLPTEVGEPGSMHEYILSPVYTNGGTIEAVLVTARDITERKQVESMLQYQALHDGLTGLANRALLHDRLEQAIISAQRSKDMLALLFLDVNDFKHVNDTVGHAAGDLLLQELSRRLSRVLRGSDTLSRFGGDEFVVLLPGTDESGAVETVARLQEQIRGPFDIEGTTLRIHMSIGIAVNSGGTADARVLLRQADEAMYRMKRESDTDAEWLRGKVKREDWEKAEPAGHHMGPCELE